MRIAPLPLLLAIACVVAHASGAMDVVPGADQEDVSKARWADPGPLVAVPSVTPLPKGPLLSVLQQPVVGKGLNFGVVSTANITTVTRTVCVNVGQAPVDVYFLAGECHRELPLHTRQPPSSACSL